MVTPGASDLTNPRVPGSVFWWLSRLAERLLDRQSIFDTREAYADGNHPLAYGDRRYVRALREIQGKAKTNYIELVQRSTTQKLRVKGFRFGEEGFADKDAARVWQYNDMDLQSQQLTGKAAKLGFAYAVVLPPEEEGGEPIIAMRDPRRCEIEKDPNRPTKTLAGLEFWANPAAGGVFAILYLPEATYYFQGSSASGEIDLTEKIAHSGVGANINNFQLVDAVANPLGEVQLIRGDWDPEFGDAGRAEGEGAWDIQDRINKTVLDRLVISNSQAYRQRWVSGAPKPPTTGGRNAPWDPGADMLWMSTDKDTRFGDFQEADITQVLEAIRDDVGDLAATTQTPVTALTNRMVNVSGDTLSQAQAGHFGKVKSKQDSMGFFYERLMKLAFKYKGDTEKSVDATANTLWQIAETRSFAETSDGFQKLVASGVPLQLAMEKSGFFSDEEIAWAVAEAEKLKAEEMAREDAVMDKTLAAKKEEAKASPNTNSSPGGSAK